MTGSSAEERRPWRKAKHLSRRFKRCSTRPASRHRCNAGIGGNRTDQGVARLDAQVLTRRPNIVTIMFGTNDACFDEGKTQPRLAPETYEANLRHIVQRTRDAGAKPIHMTPPPLTMKWPLATKQPVYCEQGVNGPLSTYVDAVRRVAKEMDVPLVDFFTAWSGKPADELDALLPDGCHPSVAGHKLMADLIMPAVLAESTHAKGADAPTPVGFTR
jgi:lysophospholipase L1-like esterase